MNKRESINHIIMECEVWWNKWNLEATQLCELLVGIWQNRVVTGVIWTAGTTYKFMIKYIFIFYLINIEYCSRLVRMVPNEVPIVPSTYYCFRIPGIPRGYQQRIVSHWQKTAIDLKISSNLSSADGIIKRIGPPSSCQ